MTVRQPGATDFVLYCDGASRGNPGPAAIGFVLIDARGEEVVARGEAIGTTTNNVAEYRALLQGLEAALEHGVAALCVRMDSELVVRQVLGRYRVRMRITTQDWQLKLVSRMKWWRKLPGWHRREVAFRDWYAGLIDRVNLTTDAGYQQAVRVLRCPEEVTGYREVRYPKQDRVREAIEAELTREPKLSVNVNRDVLDSFRAPTHV